MDDDSDEKEPSKTTKQALESLDAWDTGPSNVRSSTGTKHRSDRYDEGEIRRCTDSGERYGMSNSRENNNDEGLVVQGRLKSAQLDIKANQIPIISANRLTEVNPSNTLGHLAWNEDSIYAESVVHLQFGPTLQLGNVEPTAHSREKLTSFSASDEQSTAFTTLEPGALCKFPSHGSVGNNPSLLCSENLLSSSSQTRVILTPSPRLSQNITTPTSSKILASSVTTNANQHQTGLAANHQQSNNVQVCVKHLSFETNTTFTNRNSGILQRVAKNLKSEKTRETREDLGEKLVENTKTDDEVFHDFAKEKPLKNSEEVLFVDNDLARVLNSAAHSSTDFRPLEQPGIDVSNKFRSHFSTIQPSNFNLQDPKSGNSELNKNSTEKVTSYTECNNPGLPTSDTTTVGSERSIGRFEAVVAKGGNDRGKPRVISPISDRFARRSNTTTTAPSGSATDKDNSANEQVGRRATEPAVLGGGNRTIVSQLRSLPRNCSNPTEELSGANIFSGTNNSSRNVCGVELPNLESGDCSIDLTCPSGLVNSGHSSGHIDIPSSISGSEDNSEERPRIILSDDVINHVKYCDCEILCDCIVRGYSRDLSLQQGSVRPNIVNNSQLFDGNKSVLGEGNNDVNLVEDSAKSCLPTLQEGRNSNSDSSGSYYYHCQDCSISERVGLDKRESDWSVDRRTGFDKDNEHKTYDWNSHPADVSLDLVYYSGNTDQNKTSSNVKRNLDDDNSKDRNHNSPVSSDKDQSSNNDLNNDEKDDVSVNNIPGVYQPIENSLSENTSNTVSDFSYTTSKSRVDETHTSWCRQRDAIFFSKSNDFTSQAETNCVSLNLNKTFKTPHSVPTKAPTYFNEERDSIGNQDCSQYSSTDKSQVIRETTNEGSENSQLYILQNENSDLDKQYSHGSEENHQNRHLFHDSSRVRKEGQGLNNAEIVLTSRRGPYEDAEIPSCYVRPVAEDSHKCGTAEFTADQRGVQRDRAVKKNTINPEGLRRADELRASFEGRDETTNKNESSSSERGQETKVCKDYVGHEKTRESAQDRGKAGSTLEPQASSVNKQTSPSSHIGKTPVILNEQTSNRCSHLQEQNSSKSKKKLNNARIRDDLATRPQRENVDRFSNTLRTNKQSGKRNSLIGKSGATKPSSQGVRGITPTTKQDVKENRDSKDSPVIDSEQTFEKSPNRVYGRSPSPRRRVIVRQTKSSILRQLKSPGSSKESTVNLKPTSGRVTSVESRCRVIKTKLLVDRNSFKNAKSTRAGVSLKGLKNVIGSGIMAEGVAINRPKTFQRQTDGRTSVTKAGLPSPSNTTVRLQNSLKDGMEASTDRKMEDKASVETTKGRTKEGKGSLSAKAGMTLGFLRQTQSQVSKMRDPLASKGKTVGDATSLHSKTKATSVKGGQSSRNPEKGDKRHRSASVASKSSSLDTNNVNQSKHDEASKTKSDSHVVSPILRKASRKENICSDSPAKIQSPRSRKKLSILGVASCPVVLSPVTSPTSDNEVTSPMSTRNEMASSFHEVDSKPVRHAKSSSPLSSSSSSSKLRESVSPSPRTDKSRISPRRQKSTSVSPSNQNQRSPSREKVKDTKQNAAITTKTLSSSKTATRSQTTPPISSTAPSTFSSTSHRSSSTSQAEGSSSVSISKSSSAKTSTSSSSKTTTTPAMTTGKSTHQHRLSQNRSPSFLPVATRQSSSLNTGIRNTANSISSSPTKGGLSTKTSTSGHRDQRKDRAVTDHNKNAHENIMNDPVDTKNLLGHLHDGVKTGKTCDKGRRNEKVQQVKERKSPRQEGKPTFQALSIDIVDHVTSGIQAAGSVPLHGSTNLESGDNTSQIAEQEEVVQDIECTRQDTIDLSANVYKNKDEYDNQWSGISEEHADMNKLVEHSEKVRNEERGKSFDFVGVEHSKDKLTRSGSSSSSKKSSASPSPKLGKKAKESENMRVKSQSPELGRKTHRHSPPTGKTDGSNKQNPRRRASVGPKCQVASSQIKEEERTSHVQSRSHTPKNELSKSLSTSDNTRSEKNKSTHTGLMAKESKLPRKTKPIQVSDKTTVAKKSNITRNNVSKTQQTFRSKTLRKQISPASSISDVKSVASTRESSVDSRFDDDSVSVTSGRSSVTSSITGNRPISRVGGKATRLTLANKGKEMLKTGPVTKQTGTLKGKPSAPKSLSVSVNVNAPSANTARLTHPSKSLRTDRTNTAIDRTGVMPGESKTLSTKSVKPLNKKQQGKTYGARETTQGEIKRKGKGVEKGGDKSTGSHSQQGQVGIWQAKNGSDHKEAGMGAIADDKGESKHALRVINGETKNTNQNRETKQVIIIEGDSGTSSPCLIDRGDLLGDDGVERGGEWEEVNEEEEGEREEGSLGEEMRGESEEIIDDEIQNANETMSVTRSSEELVRATTDGNRETADGNKEFSVEKLKGETGIDEVKESFISSGVESNEILYQDGLTFAEEERIEFPHTDELTRKGSVGEYMSETAIFTPGVNNKQESSMPPLTIPSAIQSTGEEAVASSSILSCVDVSPAAGVQTANPSAEPLSQHHDGGRVGLKRGCEESKPAESFQVSFPESESARGLNGADADMCEVAREKNTQRRGRVEEETKKEEEEGGEMDDESELLSHLNLSCDTSVCDNSEDKSKQGEGDVSVNKMSSWDQSEKCVDKNSHGITIIDRGSSGEILDPVFTQTSQEVDNGNVFFSDAEKDDNGAGRLSDHSSIEGKFSSFSLSSPQTIAKMKLSAQELASVSNANVEGLAKSSLVSTRDSVFKSPQLTASKVEPSTFNGNSSKSLADQTIAIGLTEPDGLRDSDDQIMNNSHHDAQFGGNDDLDGAFEIGNGDSLNTCGSQGKPRGWESERSIGVMVDSYDVASDRDDEVSAILGSKMDIGYDAMKQEDTLTCSNNSDNRGANQEELFENVVVVEGEFKPSISIMPNVTLASNDKEDSPDPVFSKGYVTNDAGDSDNTDACISEVLTEALPTAYQNAREDDKTYSTKSFSESSDGTNRDDDLISYTEPSCTSSEVRDGGKEGKAEDVEEGRDLEGCSSMAKSHKTIADLTLDESRYQTAMGNVLLLGGGFEEDSRYEEDIIAEDYDVDNINVPEEVSGDNEDGESSVSSESSFQSATSDILMAAVSSPTGEFAFFEGCGTSKAGEGMAKLIPSDSETLDTGCWEDVQNTGEKVEIEGEQESSFSLDQTSEDKDQDNTSSMPFTSTPKVIHHSQHYQRHDSTVSSSPAASQHAFSTHTSTSTYSSNIIVTRTGSPSPSAATSSTTVDVVDLDTLLSSKTSDPHQRLLQSGYVDSNPPCKLVESHRVSQRAQSDRKGFRSISTTQPDQSTLQTLSTSIVRNSSSSSLSSSLSSSSSSLSTSAAERVSRQRKLVENQKTSSLPVRSMSVEPKQSARIKLSTSQRSQSPSVYTSSFVIDVNSSAQQQHPHKPRQSELKNTSSHSQTEPSKSRHAQVKVHRYQKGEKSNDTLSQGKTPSVNTLGLTSTSTVCSDAQKLTKLSQHQNFSGEEQQKASEVKDHVGKVNKKTGPFSQSQSLSSNRLSHARAKFSSNAVSASERTEKSTRAITSQEPNKTRQQIAQNAKPTSTITTKKKGKWLEKSKRFEPNDSSSGSDSKNETKTSTTKQNSHSINRSSPLTSNIDQQEKPNKGTKVDKIRNETMKEQGEVSGSSASHSSSKHDKQNTTSQRLTTVTRYENIASSHESCLEKTPNTEKPGFGSESSSCIQFGNSNRSSEMELITGNMRKMGGGYPDEDTLLYECKSTDFSSLPGEVPPTPQGTHDTRTSLFESGYSSDIKSPDMRSPVQDLEENDKEPTQISSTGDEHQRVSNNTEVNISLIPETDVSKRLSCGAKNRTWSQSDENCQANSEALQSRLSESSGLRLEKNSGSEKFREDGDGAVKEEKERGVDRVMVGLEITGSQRAQPQERPSSHNNNIQMSDYHLKEVNKLVETSDSCYTSGNSNILCEGAHSSDNKKRNNFVANSKQAGHLGTAGISNTYCEGGPEKPNETFYSPKDLKRGNTDLVSGLDENYRDLQRIESDSGKTENTESTKVVFDTQYASANFGNDEVDGLEIAGSLTSTVHKDSGKYVGEISNISEISGAGETYVQDRDSVCGNKNISSLTQSSSECFDTHMSDLSWRNRAHVVMNAGHASATESFDSAARPLLSTLKQETCGSQLLPSYENTNTLAGCTLPDTILLQGRANSSYLHSTDTTTGSSSSGLYDNNGTNADDIRVNTLEYHDSSISITRDQQEVKDTNKGTVFRGDGTSLGCETDSSSADNLSEKSGLKDYVEKVPTVPGDMQGVESVSRFDDVVNQDNSNWKTSNKKDKCYLDTTDTDKKESEVRSHPSLYIYNHAQTDHSKSITHQNIAPNTSQFPSLSKQSIVQEDSNQDESFQGAASLDDHYVKDRQPSTQMPFMTEENVNKSGSFSIPGLTVSSIVVGGACEERANVRRADKEVENVSADIIKPDSSESRERQIRDKEELKIRSESDKSVRVKEQNEMVDNVNKCAVSEVLETVTPTISQQNKTPVQSTKSYQSAVESKKMQLANAINSHNSSSIDNHDAQKLSPSHSGRRSPGRLPPGRLSPVPQSGRLSPSPQLGRRTPGRLSPTLQTGRLSPTPPMGRRSPSPHAEHPKEKSPLILGIVYELQRRIAAQGSPERTKSSLSLDDPKSLFGLKTSDMTPEEKERVTGARVVSKWKSMVRKSKVLAIRESLKVKLSVQEESKTQLPPPISPTPPRKYKWARGDTGIWKKVYLDEIEKSGEQDSENMETGDQNDTESEIHKNQPGMTVSSNSETMTTSVNNQEPQIREDVQHSTNKEMADKSKEIVDVEEITESEEKTFEIMDESQKTGNSALPKPAQIPQQSSSFDSTEKSEACSDRLRDNEINATKNADKFSTKRGSPHLHEKPEAAAGKNKPDGEEFVGRMIPLRSFNEEPVQESELCPFENTGSKESNEGSHAVETSHDYVTDLFVNTDHVAKLRSIDPRGAQIDGPGDNDVDAIRGEETNLTVENVTKGSKNATASGHTATPSNVASYKVKDLSGTTSKPLLTTGSMKEDLDTSSRVKNPADCPWQQMSTNTNHQHNKQLENISKDDGTVAGEPSGEKHVDHKQWDISETNSAILERHSNDLVSFPGYNKGMGSAVGKQCNSVSEQIIGEEPHDTGPDKAATFVLQKDIIGMNKYKDNNKETTTPELPLTSKLEHTSSSQGKETSDYECGDSVKYFTEPSSRRREHVSTANFSQDPIASSSEITSKNAKLIVRDSDNAEEADWKDLKASLTECSFMPDSCEDDRTRHDFSVMGEMEEGVRDNKSISIKELGDKPEVPVTYGEKQNDNSSLDNNFDRKDQQPVLSGKEKIIQTDGIILANAEPSSLRENNAVSNVTENRPSTSAMDVKPLRSVPAANVKPEKGENTAKHSEFVKPDTQQSEKDNDENKKIEKDEPKTKKYSWPTVAESLKRFQKSIAATPPRGHHLQRGREKQHLMPSRKDATGTSESSDKGTKYGALWNKAKQEIRKNETSRSKLSNAGRSSPSEKDFNKGSDLGLMYGVKNKQRKDNSQSSLISETISSDSQNSYQAPERSNTADNLMSSSVLSKQLMTSSTVSTDSQSSVDSSLSFASSVSEKDIISRSTESPSKNVRPQTLQSSSSKPRSDQDEVLVKAEVKTTSSVSPQPADKPRPVWTSPTATEKLLPPSPIITSPLYAQEATLPPSPIKIRPSWSPPTALEKILPPSPVITLSPEAILKNLPQQSLTTPGDKPDLSSQLIQEDQQQQKPQQKHGLNQEPSVEESLESTEPSTSNTTSTATADTGQSLVCSPRQGTRRPMQSAKLISVSVWDTHDGDKTLRPTRRLWDPEEKPILAGISEIEEVQPSQDSATNKGGNLDPPEANRLQAGDDCRQRVRASRSPVRPHTRQRSAPRRSLSLPSGGLSYGDVKILYRDGHFVTVGTSAERAPADGRKEGVDGNSSESVSDEKSGDKDKAVGSSRKKNRKGDSPKDGTQDINDIEGNMRAEILSLLERGITGPQRMLIEASLAPDHNSNSWELPGPSVSRRTKAGAPVFLSLPRRRSKGQRPTSMDEARLLKYYSKSQQSLVSQDEMDRRRRDEEEGGVGMRDSSLKRNNSFHEAMGSNLMLNDVGEEGEEDYHKDADAFELSDSGFDDSTQRQMEEESRNTKSRSRGPGFIQRMLQKRKGSTSERSLSVSSNSSSRSQREDLSASSLSLVSTSSAMSQQQQQTSPVKRDNKDSSVSRKMSFKSIFKRKNSGDSSGRKTPSISDEPNSPPIATFLHDDDIGALPTSPTAAQRLRNVGEADLLRDGLINNDELDSLSPTSSRSRSPRMPLSNSSSQNSLYRSLSHDNCDRTPTPINRRTRSSSGRTRSRNTIPSPTERLSGDSSEYDYGYDLHSSEDNLTPRAVSPCVGDISTDGERTLVASPTSFTDRLSPPIYQQLTASPPSGRRRTSRENVVSQKLSVGDRGDITSSNSNDSGIQNDANVNSSAESIQAPVKLRKSKSPSPPSERPKSDITVRWADLLEQVMETGSVTYRRQADKLRKRPRPKSDIDESLEDEGLENEESDDEREEEGEEEEDTEGGCHIPEPRRSALLNANSMGNINTGATAPGPLSGQMSLTTPGSASDIMMHSGESLLSLVELRRPGRDSARDVLSAKLAKFRRLSTPQPITLRAEKPKAKPSRAKHVTPVLTHAHSMPENLDKLTRKKNYCSLIGSDAQSITSQQSVGDVSSDESEYSGDYHPEKSLSTRSSHVMLAALDQMLEEENLTYAEALWDHVTMDPEELGFRAGDLIRVTDNSDKHWWFGVLDDNEGWFPATFVRLRVNQDVMEDELAFLLEEEMVVAQHTGNLMTTPNYLDKHQARANVVNEIIGAEREYVKHLRDVVEGYVKQARKRPEMFPIEKVTVIFSNIEEIYTFATQLLQQLEDCVNKEKPHLSELGKCFLDKMKGFEMYSDYCNNHPAACEELRELYRNKRYRHFFEACRLLQEMIEIPLEGFLLTPVQKICKYHLQLAELLKFTPTDHKDYSHVQGALEAMKKIATLINERKRKMESIEKLAAWQLLVDDWEGPDILEGSSELIYSGDLNKINHAGWSQERYFFLFDHQLIYCKKDLLKKSSFCYKGRIDMDCCEVVDVTDGRDSQYNVTARNAWKLHDTHKDKWYLLVAKTMVIKQRWLKAFQDERRRVKDDTENNFNIPVHVKQAVITNFKQKTNLNKPKGKAKFARTNSSSTLGSQSQVNAIATLPRNKGGRKIKSDSTLGKNKKINWFFLGKGKS